MKIIQFTLENFKSFKSNHNRLYKANDINFIYGENNSGKSNILKFLKLIFSLKRKTNQIEVEGESLSQSSSSYFFDGIIDNEPYIFHKNSRSNDIEFKFYIELSHKELEGAEFQFFNILKKEYLKDQETANMLKLEGKIVNLDTRTSEIELTTVHLNNKEVFNYEKNQEYYFRSGEGEMELLGNRHSFFQFISYLNSITLYIDNDRFFRKEKVDEIPDELESQNFKNWLYRFSLDEFQYDNYLELLSFIRENSIQSLGTLSNLNISYTIDKNGYLELMLNNGSERLPLDSFGTGVSQVFYILCKIFKTDSKIILIEELELNLSPKTQRELFKILRSLINRGIIDQVFFTSHSKYFNFRNDFSIYEIAIDSDGISSITKKDGQSKIGFFNAYKLD